MARRRSHRGRQDDLVGQPLVTNGIPLSKIHHAAFDAHLIGIHPDFRMHVSDRLLGQNDGPMLEALKELNGRNIRLPGPQGTILTKIDLLCASSASSKSRSSVRVNLGL
ncbi:HNH endonuclease [Bradyrhizobium sp. JYMT SZCCT0428]|uniref:HNH endonuclease n=1 Tax=Bradyrhizobium sp. JYMT SZCCT0428 TaxID=2807673 RepID=UPI003908AB70